MHHLTHLSTQEYRSPVEDESDFEYIRHPELRPEIPYSEIIDEKEPSEYAPSYDFLRRDSDSPDPLSLCLFPTYLSAFDELSLLSFLGKADPCEPFEPKTLQQAMNSH
jgi:hypothetical protein